MDARKERTKIEFRASRFRKTDSPRWRDCKFKHLTSAQVRIRDLCEGFIKGEVTAEEFKRELPPILNARDREKRHMNA